MFVVGPKELPDDVFVSEAVEAMSEALHVVRSSPIVDSLHFVGEVYCDTSKPDLFSVVAFSGRITSLIVSKPPSFNVLLDEAEEKIGERDCPGPDIDGLFDDFTLTLEEAQLSRDCDEFAGSPTVDPHYVTLPIEQNTEVTIRFDRLGSYGVTGVSTTRQTN